MRVIAAGHICADLIPDLPSDTTMVPGQLIEVGPLAIEAGGAVANTGRALARLGHSVLASARIGRDDLASILRERLAHDGLDISGLEASGQATSYSVVVQPRGANRSFWHHPGANDSYDGKSLDVADADMLHLGYPPVLAAMLADGGAGLRALLRRALDAGAMTSVDMVVVDRHSAAAALDWSALYGSFLPCTDVFTPSIDDLASTLPIEGTSPSAIGRVADRLIELGAGIVMISAGEAGLALRAAPRARLEAGSPALARLADSWADAKLWAPARPIERLVTTNGAGDTATAALLHALDGGLAPQDAANVVTAVAAHHIEGKPISDLA